MLPAQSPHLPPPNRPISWATGPSGPSGPGRSPQKGLITNRGGAKRCFSFCFVSFFVLFCRFVLVLVVVLVAFPLVVKVVAKPLLRFLALSGDFSHVFLALSNDF